MPHATAIEKVETFVVSLPREVPYLGPLGPGESINERGYLIRQGNRSIYPASDMSVLVKMTATDGTVGWGETYGIVAPHAVTAIIDDVLGPVMVGRDPRDAVVIQEDLYDLMRVRGFFGGYYVDAIAGVDIAVWDLFGKLAGQPLVKLLGGQRMDRIPAYVSGLPRPTLDQRLELAATGPPRLRRLQVCRRGVAGGHRRRDAGTAGGARTRREADGRPALEVHGGRGDPADRPARPLPALFCRGTLPAGGHRGPGPRVAAHRACRWRWARNGARCSRYRPRFERRSMSIIQPEMGHTGVSAVPADRADGQSPSMSR